MLMKSTPAIFMIFPDLCVQLLTTEGAVDTSIVDIITFPNQDSFDIIAQPACLYQLLMFVIFWRKEIGKKRLLK
jgi:hypothetical protein